MKTLLPSSEERFPKNYFDYLGLGRKWGPIRWWGNEINKLIEDCYLQYHTTQENLGFTIGVYFENDESKRYGAMCVTDKTRTIYFGPTPNDAKRKLDEAIILIVL